jgi:hypothetical protein
MAGYFRAGSGYSSHFETSETFRTVHSVEEPGQCESDEVSATAAAAAAASSPSSPALIRRPTAYLAPHESSAVSRSYHYQGSQGAPLHSVVPVERSAQSGEKGHMVFGAHVWLVVHVCLLERCA